MQSSLSLCIFFFYGSRDHPHLHSFPTRRSSDLAAACGFYLAIVRSGTLLPLPSPSNVRQGPKFHEKGRRDSSRSEEHTSELQSRQYLVCRLLLEKKNSSTLSWSCAVSRER